MLDARSQLIKICSMVSSYLLQKGQSSSMSVPICLSLSPVRGVFRKVFKQITLIWDFNLISKYYTI